MKAMNVWTRVLAIALLLPLVWIPASAQRSTNGAGDASAISGPHSHRAKTPRDSMVAQNGEHDFDWEIGTWKTYQSLLRHSSKGSPTWLQYNGTDVIRKIWGGRANLGEIEATGPAGHLEILSLRLYNPQSHQWSFNVANRATGTLDPMFGEFRKGRAAFVDQEPYYGHKMTLIRIRAFDIHPESCDFDQSYSIDVGKTWVVNFKVAETLMGKPEPWGWASPMAQTDLDKSEPLFREPGTGQDPQHDFDFDFGTWKVHIRRLLHPLTGATTWGKYNGTDVVHKIWGGRANLAEVEANGPAGHLEFLSLRLYNPQSHQWSLNVANSADGTMNVPTIGGFKNGRGEFYDQETFDGRAVWARTTWSDITPHSYHFEEAFSDDGGKSWQPNFIAVLIREEKKGTEKQ